MNYRNQLFILSLLALSLPGVCVGEEVALYDNTHLEAKAPPFVPAGAPPPFYESSDTHGAFQFFTWDSDNVSSVSTTMMRTGSPGGTIFFEIWETGPDNLPSDTVGVVGSHAVDDLPLWNGSVVPPPVKVEGSVTGLLPMTRYYLVVRIGDDVNITGRSQTIHDAPLFTGSHAWAGPGTPNPPEGKPLHEALWQANNDGQWHTLTSALGAPPGAWQHMRITAACPEKAEPLAVDIEHAVAVSWDSQIDKVYQIHASTDMETWEIAVDGIEGTGERLTHCFLHEETEIFYRVEEAP